MRTTTLMSLGLSLSFLMSGVSSAESTQTLELELNGQTHRLSLEDLEDGEMRTFESDGHSVTVERAGDELKLVHDGVEVDAEAGLWMQEDGEVITLDSDEPKYVFIRHEGGTDAHEVDVEVLTGDEPLPEGGEGSQVRIKRIVEIEGDGTEEGGEQVEKEVRILVQESAEEEAP